MHMESESGFRFFPVGMLRETGRRTKDVDCDGCLASVVGIISKVGLQAFLNIAVVCDIIPNTGVSLPFFSYGGSSLIILMAEMGIVLSISKHSYQKK